VTGQDPAAGQAGRAGGWGVALGTPTTVLLLRHGQTALSAERRFAGRDDIPLTGEGERQAAAVARRLARSGIDVIASSPLQRARRTAEAVAEATGAAMEVDNDLAEADFGSWDGLTFAEAGQRWPQELAAWMAGPEAEPPGGESFAAVARRVLAALDRLLDQHRHKTLVIVSHVTPIKTVLCRALLAPPEAMFRINLSVASLSRIDCFDGGAAVVHSLNDTAHLHGLRERLSWRQRRASWPGGRVGSGKGADEEGPGSAGQGGR
jgi:ribonuclease H / adenosylcobalamin/alpha-ribazole phosphatase